MRLHFLAALFACVVAHGSCASIDEYGAVAGDSSIPTAFVNARAITWALQNASLAASAAGGVQQTVVVPSAQVYYFMPVAVSGLQWVTLEVNGRLVAPNNITAWPRGSKHKGGYLDMIAMQDSSDIVLTGTGVIDGQGYEWWLLGLLAKLKAHRGVMFHATNVTNMLIETLTFENSMSFHLLLEDCAHVHVRHATIWVDVEKQGELLAAHGMMHESGLPLFPLNTDGIDPSGRDFLIENVTITNYDDAVAVKPSHSGDIYNCTENVLVRNSHVTHSVGLSIGSVPPNVGTNCVRNVTFENVEMHQPIKAIYIKTNPGTEGDGIIEDITYRNIVAHESLWYPIWIGPQQQKQPGTKGTGCSFLYPIVDECPTQPRVTVKNVLLQNVTATNGLTLPGVILCNATNPCENIHFNNVDNTGYFLVKKEYVCQHAQGTSPGSTPVPSCL